MKRCRTRLFCGKLEHRREGRLLGHAEAAQRQDGAGLSGGAAQRARRIRSRGTHTRNGSLGSDVSVTLNVTLAPLAILSVSSRLANGGRQRVEDR